jgi:hypothetical protein
MKVFLLNKAFTRLWYKKKSFLPWVAPEARVGIAHMILKEFPEGAAVAICSLYVVALVKPGGKVEPLKPRYKKIQMHEAANKPTLLDCQCVDYVDLSTGGPWRDNIEARRGTHHPICQFKPDAWENVKALKIVNWTPPTQKAGPTSEVPMKEISIEDLRAQREAADNLVVIQRKE